MSQKNLYIAGPMRGYPLYNFPAFDAAAELATSLGWRVFNPAAMDRAVGVDGLTSVLPPDFTRECVMRDIAAILSCHAMAMLPGWTKSTGAKAEFSIARWLGLDILDACTMKPLASVTEPSVLPTHYTYVNKA